jgi:hypothetical protein
MQGKITPQEFMENWLKEPNYPEVSAILETKSIRTTIKFSQSRFLLSETGQDKESGYFYD